MTLESAVGTDVGVGVGGNGGGVLHGRCVRELWNSVGFVGIGVAMVDAGGVEGGGRCWKVEVGDSRLLL